MNLAAVVVNQGLSLLNGRGPVLPELFLQEGPVGFTDVKARQIQHEVCNPTGGPQFIGDAVAQHVVGNLHRIVNLDAAQHRQTRTFWGLECMVEFPEFITHQLACHARQQTGESDDGRG